MLLVGRRKEPEEEFIGLVGLVADGEITSVRFANIKVDLGESGAIDVKTYTSCNLVIISTICGNAVKPNDSSHTYLL